MPHQDSVRLFLIGWLMASIVIAVSTSSRFDWSHGWLGKALLLLLISPVAALAMVIVVAVVLARIIRCPPRATGLRVV